MMANRTPPCAGIFIVVAMIIVGCGQTAAGDIGVGDCFANPGDVGFTQVINQDCSGRHDIQVYATAPRGAPRELNLTPTEDGGEVRGLFADQEPTPCVQKLLDLVDLVDDESSIRSTYGVSEGSEVVVPDDVEVAELSSPSGTTGQVLCLAISPSGALFGSLGE